MALRTASGIVDRAWRGFVLVLVIAAFTGSELTSSRVTATSPKPTVAPHKSSLPVLRLAMPEASPSVDPALVADEENAQLANLLYSGLVRLDSHYRVIPASATSFSLSPDHKTYTFHLRRGLRFSNGDPVTASDFRFGITRSLNPAIRSPSAPTYLLDIQGAKAVLTGKARNVSGIRVIDRYTLQITARWPVPYFLMELTYPTSFALDSKRIVKQGAVDNTSWYANPIGSGPFRLKSSTPNNKIVLVPNRFFLHQHPHFKEITISLGPLPSTDTYRFVTRNLDVVSLPTANSSLRSQPGISDTKMLAIDGIYMNLKFKPFGNRLVRRALTESLDRSALVVGAMSQSATPFGGYVPPGEDGYDARLRVLRHNVRQARKDLKSAGFNRAKTLPTLVLYYADDPTISKLASQISRVWQKELNVSVATEALTLNTLLAKVQSNGLPLYLSGWSADYPDPHDWLSLQWDSRALNNDIHYHNSTFDRLVRTADVTWDQGRRRRLYDAAQEALVGDAAWVPLYIPHRLEYIRPGLQNLYVTGFGLIPKTGSWSQVQESSVPAKRHREI